MSKPFGLLDVEESALLRDLVVRLITEEERERWDREVCEHHYLKNATLVGEHLRYVVTYQGQWVACLGWSAAALSAKRRRLKASPGRIQSLLERLKEVPDPRDARRRRTRRALPARGQNK